MRSRHGICRCAGFTYLEDEHRAQSKSTCQKKNKTKKATSKNDNKPTLLDPNEDFAFGHLSKHSPLKETEISG